METSKQLISKIRNAKAPGTVTNTMVADALESLSVLKTINGESIAGIGNLSLAEISSLVVLPFNVIAPDRQKLMPLLDVGEIGWCTGEAKFLRKYKRDDNTTYLDSPEEGYNTDQYTGTLKGRTDRIFFNVSSRLTYTVTPNEYTLISTGYTKEETDELIKTAKSAVLKTLRLQWFNTGNSIGLFTATNEELTRVTGVARLTDVKQLSALLSQPREFYINDTADKFDTTADSYFTEDIDFETIQFIDEEFTAVGADALTLPVSICQGGKTIATFPAAFTRRLFNEDDPDGWHAYEGHAIFESAGSVWKFLYNALPGNNDQSLELVKISTKTDSPEVLEIFLNPEHGDENHPYRFWKGKHDRKFIYDTQSIHNVNDLFTFGQVEEKRVILDLKCLDSSGNKISVFRGEVLFSPNNYNIDCEDITVLREGIAYRVRLLVGGDQGVGRFTYVYFISSVLRQHDPTAPVHLRQGICPAFPHEGYFYRNTGEIKLGLSNVDYRYYTKLKHLHRTWDLSHFGNIEGFFDACSKGLITEGLEMGIDPVGIKVRIYNDLENHWASSDKVEFEWDSNTKKLTMNLHEQNVSRISIRVRFAAIGVPEYCPYIGRPYGSKYVTSAPSASHVTIIEDSLPAFPTKNLRLFRDNSSAVIRGLKDYLSQFHSEFQIQRMSRSKQKTIKDPTFVYKSKKWINVRDVCTASKGVFRIRYYRSRNKKSGPWQYFRLCSNANRPVRLL